MDFFLLTSLPQTDSTSGQMISFVFSTLGIILSIIAVMILILTAVLFPQWRHSYKNQLLIQLMLARFLFTFVRYFADIMKFLEICDQYFNPFYLSEFPLAYTEMALVSWMYVFTKQIYDSLAKVFNVETQSLWKVSLYAWLIPGVISTISYIIYSVQKGKEVQIYIFYLFILKWPALATNGIILASVLKSILNTNMSKTENNRRIILVMITLIFTFCIQQAVTDFHTLIFVIFTFEHKTKFTPVFFISTNIITIYHCAFSILFWLFANKRTRILWGFSREQKKQQVHVTCSTIS